MKTVQRQKEDASEVLIIFTDLMCVERKVAIRVELWALLSKQQGKEVEHLVYVGEYLMLTLSGLKYGRNS